MAPYTIQCKCREGPYHPIEIETLHFDTKEEVGTYLEQRITDSNLSPYPDYLFDEMYGTEVVTVIGHNIFEFVDMRKYHDFDSTDDDAAVGDDNVDDVDDGYDMDNTTDIRMIVDPLV